MTRRPLPTRPRRVDPLAMAERQLYPGVPWRTYTRQQRDRTVALAKLSLLQRGAWPTGTTEREDARRGRVAA